MIWTGDNPYFRPFGAFFVVKISYKNLFFPEKYYILKVRLNSHPLLHEGVSYIIIRLRYFRKGKL